MTINKWLTGCISIDNIEYPENFSLVELLSLANEAKMVNDNPNAHAIFHVDALMGYCHFGPSRKPEFLAIPVGGYATLCTQEEGYRVHRYSEHFYAAEILNVLLLYNEEVQVKNQEVKQNIKLEEKQEKKRERIPLYN